MRRQAGQLRLGSESAGSVAEGEGADDERAGTSEHRPQHAQHTETTSAGMCQRTTGTEQDPQALFLTSLTETPSFLYFKHFPDRFTEASFVSSDRSAFSSCCVSLRRGGHSLTS